MKTFYLIIFMIFSLAIQGVSFAQDEDCCEEDDKYGKEGEITNAEWQQQIEELTARKKGLEDDLSKYAKEIEELRANLSKKIEESHNAEIDYYSAIGMTKSSLEDFKKKFDETEKKILNRTGNPADARKYYFNEIEASKAKCLPVYWSRYLIMKQKLEQWEKESLIVVKEDKYKVLKGDCLWRIAGKSDFYVNPKYWPKIWEANEDGVISAPYNVPQKVTNPNLIYPGQVLRIPKLTDEDLKKLVDNTYIMKNVRKIKELESTRKDKKVIKKKKNIVKEIKKIDKTKKKVDVKKDENIKK